MLIVYGMVDPPFCLLSGAIYVVRASGLAGSVSQAVAFATTGLCSSSVQSIGFGAADPYSGLGKDL